MKNGQPMMSTERLPAFALAMLSIAACSATAYEGFTEPYRSVELSAAETGVVAKMNVRLGERVVLGHVIGSLDTRLAEADLASAQARAEATGEIDAARAAAEMRRTRRDKLRGLLDQGHATAEELAHAESELAISEARVREAGEKRRLAKLEADRIRARIEQRTFRSSIDGVVVRLHKEAGERVSLQEAAIATIVDLNKLRVNFYVTSGDAARLSKGQPVTVAIGEDQSSNDHRLVAAEITFVSPITEPDSALVQIEVVIEGGKKAVRSGLVCHLLLDSEPTPRTARRGLSLRERRR